VSFGSDVQCLRNELHEPFQHKKTTELTEAYHCDRNNGAACHPDLRNFDFDLNLLVRCHSIHWDPKFLSEPAALARATILRTEVLSYDDTMPWTSTGNRKPIPGKSCLRRNVSGIRQRHRHVAFQPFAISFDEHFPPIFQQHPDDDESDLSFLMARAPGARMPSAEPSTDSDSDLNTNPPTSPSSFGPPQEWQSAQVYDLNGNFAHGRVHTQPPEASFADIRRLLGMTHHAVANIFDIRPSPKDLQAANIAPFLLLAHTDMRFGDTRRAVLIDVELHGPTFESVVEIDRYTTLLPTPIHRSLILRIAGVLQYCSTMRNRCLLWHRGTLINARSRANLDLNHGDYIRIAVPPFEPSSISTYYAVRACQHGLNRRQIIQRHRRQPDPDELFTDVEAAQRPADEATLLQVSASDAALPQETWIKLPTTVTIRNFGECANPQYVASAPGAYQPPRQEEQNQPWPSWFSSLHQAFAEQAAIACEEEGPIAFLTTWYITGPFESVNEESRVFRLDQHHHYWKTDLVDLWRDKIDMTQDLELAYVHPQPPSHDTEWTIGHLILYQRVRPPLKPALVTIKFLTDRRTGINHAVAALESPTDALHLRDLCQLGRMCLDRLCELQISDRLFQGTDAAPFRAGNNLIFNIHPPVVTSHFGDEHVVAPQWLTTSTQTNQLEFEATPILQDQTAFIQALFPHWDVHARPGPAHLERLLFVDTWCLHSDRIRTNDEMRQVIFADDFHNWELHLRSTWQDLLEPQVEVDFAIVWDSPERDHDLSRIHIIVHQLLRPVERATLVTTYDDTLAIRQPYTTAAILPSITGQTQLLQAVHRENDCPPRNPHTTCTTWQRGWQFSDAAPYRCRHGQVFMLIITPAQPQLGMG
jgi:hypothetical protein